MGERSFSIFNSNNIYIFFNRQLDNKTFYFYWYYHSVNHFFRYIYFRILPSKGKRPFQRELECFIYENDLDIVLSYQLNKNKMLNVIVGKNFGNHDLANKLSSALESALNMSVYRIVEEKQFVIYKFSLNEIKRNTITEFFPNRNTKINLYDDINLDLNKNWSLICSGVSGSGKSTFIFGIVCQYLSKSFPKKIDGELIDAAPSLFVIDPKQSDLEKLMRVSGMSSNRYGSSVSDAFRVIREFTNELDRRKAIYSSLDVFDKTMLNLGYEPCLLIGVTLPYLRH